MPVNTRKLADLKNEILAKIDDKVFKFKDDILETIKNWSCRSIQE